MSRKKTDARPLDPGDDRTITNSIGSQLTIANAEGRPLVLFVVDHPLFQRVIIPFTIDEAQFVVVAIEKSIAVAREAMS